MAPEPKIPVRPDPTRKTYDRPPGNPSQSEAGGGWGNAIFFIAVALLVLVMAWAIIERHNRPLNDYERRNIGGVVCIYNVTEDKIEDCVDSPEDSEAPEAFQSVLEAQFEGSKSLQNIPFSAILSA